MAKKPNNFIEQLVASNDINGRTGLGAEANEPSSSRRRDPQSMAMYRRESRDILQEERVNPILNPSEIQRLENESNIVAKVFHQVWQTLKADEKGKTELSLKDKAEGVVIKEKKQKKMKLSELAKFGLLITGVIAAASMLFDFFGPVGRFFAKTLPKLLRPIGKLGKWIGKGMKAVKLGRLLKYFQKIGGGRLLKFGRFLPFIGSLFSFGFAIARWQKGEYIPAIFEFVSGVLNLLPLGFTQIASIIIDGGLLLYDLHKAKKEEAGALGEPGKAGPPSGELGFWGKIKNWVWNFPGVQNLVNLGYGVGAVLNGDWGAAADYFDKALPFIGATIRWLIEAGEETGDMAWRGFKTAGEFFGEVAVKIVNVFKSVWNTIYEWVKGIPGWVKDRVLSLGGFVVEGLTDFGGWIGSGFGAFDGSKAEKVSDGFIAKNGVVTRIDDNDQGLVFKKGGPIAGALGTALGDAHHHHDDKELFGKIAGGLKEVGKAVASANSSNKKLSGGITGGLKEVSKAVASANSSNKEFFGGMARVTGWFKETAKNANEALDREKGTFEKIADAFLMPFEALYKGGSSLTKDFIGTGEVVTEIKQSNIILTLIWEQLAALNKGGGGSSTPPPPLVASVPEQNNDMSGSMEGPGPYDDSHVNFYKSSYNIHAV